MNAPAAPRVVLYGRAGCHLCDEARAVVARVCTDVGVAWVEVDVDATPVDRGVVGAGAADASATGATATGAAAADVGAADAGATGATATGTSPAVAGLAAAYGDRVPVVVVDGVDVAQWQVSERALRAALA